MGYIEKIIQQRKQSYSINWGPEKLEKIEYKIYNSQKIRKLIQQSQQKMISPNKNDFIYAVNEIPFFIFSKKETIFMGVICALDLWHKTVNISYQYMDEFTLDKTFAEILNDFNK